MLTLLAWFTSPWSAVSIGGLRPTDLLLLGALVLAVATIPGRPTTYRHPLVHRFLTGLGLIVLGALIGALWSGRNVNFYLALPRAALAALPLMVLLQLRADTEVLRRCGQAFVLGTVVLVLVGTATGMTTPVSGRFRGLAVHPNQVGMTCTISVAYLGLLSPGRRIRELPHLGQLARIATFVVLLYGISESGSRSGFLALTVVLAVIAFRWLRNHPGRLATAGTLVVFAIPVLLATNYNSASLARLTGADERVAESNLERESLYAENLAELHPQRVLFGGAQFDEARPHSIVIEMVLANGVTGLAGLLVLFVPPVLWLRRHVDDSSVLTASCLAVFGYMVNVALNNALWARFTWCALAMVYVARLKEVQASRKDASLVSLGDGKHPVAPPSLDVLRGTRKDVTPE